MNPRYYKKKNGQTFLGLVLLIGGIVVTVGALLAFLANSLIDSTYGYKAVASAAAAANSGVQDALLQLDRNPDFSDPGGYLLITGSSSATVFITQDSPTAGYITVVASSTVFNRTRKLSVLLVHDASTTAPTVISWQEIP